MTAPYVTDEAHGLNWEFWLGDSAERMAEIEAESIDLSVYSPPFASLYTYSDSPRDMGNATDRGDFFDQYGYIIRENLRITKPGRLACVHVSQTALLKSRDGYVGLTDFRGDVIRAYQDAGWIYWGEATVDKDPQAQAIRTKAQQLMFVSKNKDSTIVRPAMADYLLIFKKQGDNAVRVKTDVTNEEWIDWAHPIWLDIREGNTLNAKVARESDDERHMTPLQLEFIERCVRLYSNPGEKVFSGFGGIGSELYVAVKCGRKALGIELKASYWKTGCRELEDLETRMAQPRFDMDAIA